jgi:hypothetical protein
LVSSSDSHNVLRKNIQLSYVITTQIKALIQQEKEEDEDGRVQKNSTEK